jgi:hypothetical protein
MHPMTETSFSHFRAKAASSLGLAICLTITALVPASLVHAQSAVAPLRTRSMEARSAFATAIENQLRQAGKDTRVQLDGDQRDVLRIDWQKVSRRDLHAFFNSATANDQAELLGLRTIVVSSGAQRWDYNVARQSLVWSPSQQ